MSPYQEKVLRRYILKPLKGCQIQPYQIETLPQLHKSFDILEHTVTKTWPLGQSRRVEIILEGPVSLDQRGYYW